MSVENIKDIIAGLKAKETFSKVAIEDFAPHGQWAYKIAAYLGKKMKTNQLRKVFAELKQIEVQQKGKAESSLFEDSRIYLLIPQLAYAKARELIRDDFYDMMKIIIGDGRETTKIRTVGDYRRFVDFMTAIVAYHKEHSK